MKVDWAEVRLRLCRVVGWGGGLGDGIRAGGLCCVGWVMGAGVTNTNTDCLGGVSCEHARGSVWRWPVHNFSPNRDFNVLRWTGPRSVLVSVRCL